MLIKRFERIVEKNWNEVQGILLRQYPAFIFSDQAECPATIPAFVFHDVTPESLEPALRFLSENRYVTLTADEYTDRLIHRDRGYEREALLTFDDGDKSLYTVAYPALKCFGLRAVAYIVPGIIAEGEESNPLNRWRRSLCNWREIQEMHESGTLDIQSHSMYHQSIPVSGRVVDFVRPGMNLCFEEPNLALPIDEEKEWWKKSDRIPNGVPIFDGGSRFGEARAFREGASLILACVQHVNRHGGANYFRRPGWRVGLKTLVARTRKRTPSRGFESDAEQRRLILRDLVSSKHTIERKLPGKTVRHFCYPWFRGSALAAKLSAEAGYISNAWGSLVPRQTRGMHFPVAIQRLAPPYIFRLPGRGRLSVSSILLNWARNATRASGLI